ncbi:MAG: SDR family oxidoreductase [Candidatus Rokubacteria bacterium]|nr:SDR family oxidoreductase [Candidatus Rokubacteria bacterium]
MDARGRAVILVTGATGFLGRAVVRRLLAERHPVVALARPRAGAPAAARVAAAVGRRPDGDGFRVVAGDLTRAGAGLTRADAAWLRARVTAVIHCAGDTSFRPAAPDAFRRGHVDGPRDLLVALAAGRLRRFTQVSTAFVCGRREGVAREDEADVGQAFHNAYERAKLDAEAAVRAAGAARGVAVTVLRPSVVVGDAPPTAGGLPSNLFFDFIRLVAYHRDRDDGGELRIAARPRAPFNVVGVDDAARVIAVLAALPEAAGRTAHVVVSAPPTQDAVLREITGRLGARGVRLVDGPLAEATREERVVMRALNGYREYLTQDVRFDDTTARRLLAAAHARPPRLEAGDIHDLMDAAKRWR